MSNSEFYNSLRLIVDTKNTVALINIQEFKKLERKHGEYRWVPFNIGSLPAIPIKTSGFREKFIGKNGQVSIKINPIWSFLTNDEQVMTPKIESFEFTEYNTPVNRYVISRIVGNNPHYFSNSNWQNILDKHFIKRKNAIEWDKNIENTSSTLIQSVPAYVVGLSNEDIRILGTIREQGVSIDSIAEEMASGISTGGDKIFRISKDFAIQNLFEEAILKNVLVGAEIDCYKISNTNNVIIYSTKEAQTPQYEHIFEYLKPYKEKLSAKRETKKGTLPWWCLHWPRYNMLFDEPKIIMRQTSDSIRCVYDEKGFYVLNSILVFKKNTSEYTYKYLSTVLNSTLTDYLYKKLTQEEGRTFAEVKPANVRKLYIPKATQEEQNILSILYDYMAVLKGNNMPQPISSMNVLFIDLFERIIDGCIYELFFREHMKERGIDIMTYLPSFLKPIKDLKKDDVINTIIAVHSSIFMTDNPVRTRLKLFVSRSPEILKLIIQH